MELKLVIDGNDRRIRIVPNDNFDIKILELLSEANGSDIEIRRADGQSRRGEIENIDLKLYFTKGKKIKMPGRQDLIQKLKINRSNFKNGKKDKYWDSVAAVVENFYGL